MERTKKNVDRIEALVRKDELSTTQTAFLKLKKEEAYKAAGELFVIEINERRGSLGRCLFCGVTRHGELEVMSGEMEKPGKLESDVAKKYGLKIVTYEYNYERSDCPFIYLKELYD